MKIVNMLFFVLCAVLCYCASSLRLFISYVIMSCWIARDLSLFMFCLLLSCELFEVVYFECDYQFWKCLRNSANLAQTGHGMVSVRIWRLVLDFKIT